MKIDVIFFQGRGGVSAPGLLACDCALTIPSRFFFPRLYPRGDIVSGCYEFLIATDMRGNIPRIQGRRSYSNT